MIGIIGYGTRTGLGIMTHEFRTHLGIEKQLVIPHDKFPMDFNWAANQFLSLTWEIDNDTLKAWIEEEEIDTVISIETTYGDRTFRWAQEIGAKVFFLPMWEWYNPHHPAYQNVDLYACTSFKCYQEIAAENKLYIPCPVDTDAIPFKLRSGKARTFIHNAGTGGMAGRKGTTDTVRGFLRADVDAKLIVRTQVPISKYGCAKETEDPRITVIEGTIENNADLYADGDVLIYCSKYDGQSLVGEEAMCAGLPLITTDAEPMNEFLPPGDQLLVRVRERVPAGTINPHCEANLIDINDLAEKITWCTEHDMEPISYRNRSIIERDYSWATQKEKWLTALANVSQRLDRH